MKHLLCIAAVAVLAPSLLADVIEAAPGDGTISAAAAKAKDGDTIRLAAGAYSDSVNLPGGVTLEGAGAGQTVLTATDYAGINCRGPGITVRGVTVKPGERTVRGVNTSEPVRVERCRFEGVKEGVALMAAPLSDVVACDFVECGIGVRAIAEACPTVWGCRFVGGGMGVFAMEGMPYIRDNLFVGQRTGIKLFVTGAEQAIIRNNLFVRCTESGIELASKEAVFGPSIRNNVFEQCGAAVIGGADMVGATSYALVHGVKAPAIRDTSGAETLKLGDRSVTEVDAGISVGDDGLVTMAHPELVEGKGVRDSEAAETAVGDLGLEKAWLVSGAAATGSLPAVRFKEPNLIANAVAEEYQYLRAKGLGMGRQSTGVENGRPVDRLACTRDGQRLELVFDIGRFYGEMSIK